MRVSVAGGLIILGLYVAVVTGVGTTFGWQLGFAAGAACWLVSPWKPER